MNVLINMFLGRSRYSLFFVVALPVFMVACSATRNRLAFTFNQVAMSSPGDICRIEIIEPFTRVRDFDQDGSLDGIELLMKAVNSQGNPGPQIVGNLNVELYEFVEASAQRKGKRIDRWGVDLSSADLQEKHWNQLTQMYEFRLEVDPEVLPHKKKFVLAVTYNTPDNVHYMDECVLEHDVRGYMSSRAGPGIHDAG